jgi:integrase
MIDTEGLSIYDYCHKRLFNYIKLKGYSEANTYIPYRANLNLVLQRFPEPEKAGLLQIQEFAASFKNDNTRKNICVMLRWLFNQVFNRNIAWQELPYPKKKKKVQPIYSEADILKVLAALENKKHKAIIALITDCGLRISEPCAMLIADCNSKQRSMVLRSAKGDNDRIIYPSEYVWQRIREYWAELPEKPQKYLFEGQRQGLPYTQESIRAFVKQHCKKSGVKYLGVHAIRRFTGTWKVENGVPETVVADSLGHASVKTLHKHYLIHSKKYLQNIQTPLACR